ncbi:unnamed protein product, partial [marine sediment metagenome]
MESVPGEETRKERRTRQQAVYQRTQAGKATSKRYYERHSKQVKERVSEYRGRNPKYQQEYRNTIIGYLRYTYGNMKNRCTNYEHHGYRYYGGRGIQCLFVSSQGFVDYVIKELQIDPRGKQVHRINNNKHYEPGNITFVTNKEHD